MKRLHDGGTVSDDTPTKITARGREPLTPAELARAQADRDIAAADGPMREWQAAMAAHDRRMPRALEDVIDALPATTRDRIAAETLQAYQAKKEVRARKPA